MLTNEYSKQYQQAISEYGKQLNQPITREEAGRIGDSVTIDFIKQHPYAYYSIYLLNVMASSLDADYPFIETAMSKLSDEIRNSYRGRELAQRIVMNNRVGIGKEMPEFEQADTLARPVRLSDFRGKYLFVDFWASWCGPCRIENPHFVEAYKTFNTDGFDILSVSLDESKSDWLEAIHKDGLSGWNHVSDLKGFDNTIAKLFLFTPFRITSCWIQTAKFSQEILMMLN